MFAVGLSETTRSKRQQDGSVRCVSARLQGCKAARQFHSFQSEEPLQHVTTCNRLLLLLELSRRTTWQLHAKLRSSTKLWTRMRRLRRLRRLGRLALWSPKRWKLQETLQLLSVVLSLFTSIHLSYCVFPCPGAVAKGPDLFGQGAVCCSKHCSKMFKILTSLFS